MMNRCLYCYKELEKDLEGDFHQKCSLEIFGSATAPVLSYSLNQMSKLAKDVVERSVAVTGVQPKLSLTLVKDTMAKESNSRLTVVGALGGNYILKPPTEHFPEMPQNEHVTMRIAEAFGIKTVKSSLIRLQSGELSYITRRVDRTNTGEKIHMLDMFQIIGANDKYKSSMERIGKAIEEFSDDTLLDQLSFFELGLFSFLTGNNDMHLKNFSMINNSHKWVLAPAYDLLNVAIVNPKDTEELALTIQGKKKKFSLANFKYFGKGLDLNEKQIEGVFKRFEKNKPIAVEWIENSFLSDDFKEKYIKVLAEKFKILNQ